MVRPQIILAIPLVGQRFSAGISIDHLFCFSLRNIFEITISRLVTFDRTETSECEELRRKEEREEVEWEEWDEDW